MLLVLYHAGMSSTCFGKEMGIRPEGFTRPKRTSAMAFPASFPEYHAWMILETEPAQV